MVTDIFFDLAYSEHAHGGQGDVLWDLQQEG